MVFAAQGLPVLEKYSSKIGLAIGIVVIAIPVLVILGWCASESDHMIGVGIVVFVIQAVLRKDIHKVSVPIGLVVSIIGLLSRRVRRSGPALRTSPI